MVILLFVAQLHFCTPAYSLPDGKRCVVCPTLVDRESDQTQIAADHGDCHDCCTASGCTDQGLSKIAKAFAPALSMAIALPAPLSVEIPFLIVPRATIFAALENCPATGPPCLPSTRAPPSLPA